jgi:hypothetical protein
MTHKWLTRQVTYYLICLIYICKQGSDNDGFGCFGNISISKKVPKRSEIDVYLSLAVENVKDPLTWWVNNSQTYPTLSRTARDYLSIPGKSKSITLQVDN